MKSTVATLLLASALICQAQEGAAASHYVNIEKVEATLQESPQYAARGPREKDNEARNWVEIEADLLVICKDKTAPEFIPQLDAKWYAILTDGLTKKPVQLTGSVTFKDLRFTASTRDKKLHLSAYISPDTLEKITREKTIRINDIQAVALVVSGATILGEAKHLQRASAHEETEWWTKTLYPVMDGAILPKSKTPFALLWNDRYPMEKTADK